MITYIDLIPPQDTYQTAILIKPTQLKQYELNRYYVDPYGLKDVIAFGLEQGKTKKPNKTTIREHCTELFTNLKELGVTYLLVADAEYCKFLTSKTKLEDTYGYELDCTFKGYEDFKIVYVTNYAGLFYNPVLQDKIDLSLNSFNQRLLGNNSIIGDGIIHFEEYPDTYEDIKSWLTKLHQYPELTCDLETFSLKHWLAGIGTIGFAWNQHEGIAFCVDYKENLIPTDDGFYGHQIVNESVYGLLLEFFNTYQGKLIFHNCTFDIKILIYVLYMSHLLDQKGLLKGLHTLHRDVEDTKLIKYLATNTCALNPLDLKSASHEFTGKYAQEEINDIRKIPKKELLKYNLIDCLATWYVRNKFNPIMVADNQEPIYRDLFLPSAKVINQIQLTGMCMDMDKVLEAEQTLIADKAKFNQVILDHPLLKKAVYNLRKTKWEKDYQDRVKKAKKPENIKYKDFDVIQVEFNPNSGQQLIELLYNQIGLPVIDKTKTGLPATGGKTLKKLKNHTDDEEVKGLLGALDSYSKAEKILTAFIPVFKSAPKGNDGCHYLFGSLILGGTKSGRLSSREPNMQTIPSGSYYGKLIKACFIAARGKLFWSSDFNSLESVINTLLTKDPEKEKILIDRYDSHSFNTYYYWPHEFPDVNPNSAESVNWIKTSGHKLRGASKGISFSLQYFGTHHTVMNDGGFPLDEAMKIVDNYHTLYKVSMKWADDKINLAAKKGYAELAFGLRLKAPVLSQVLTGIRRTPTEASAEYRTLGNAVSGQSYGLLNNRAVNAFMELVWASPYAEVIKPSNLIHDAIYGYCDEDIEQVKYINDNLIECMAWQELPELQHPQIKIGSELDIYYQGWHQEITLPNNASEDEILTICKETSKEYK